MRQFSANFLFTLLGACLVGALEGLVLLPSYDAGRNAIEWLHAFVLYGALALLLSVLSSVLAVAARRPLPRCVLPAANLWAISSVVALFWMHRSAGVPAAGSPAGMVASAAVVLSLLVVAALSCRALSGRSPSRASGRIVVLALCCGLLLGAATIRVSWPRDPWGGRAEPRADAPPVILVLVDTLRRDHLPTFGYGRPTAPRLSEFADECLRFEGACTGGSRTVPSIATLFSGVHPSTHGVSTQQHSLNEQLRTLPELFRHAGYRTAAFVGNGTMRPDMGYARGFDQYLPRPLPPVLARRKTALEMVLLRVVGYDRSPTVDTLVPRALDWLRQSDTRPPFLYLHIMEPHSTYAPPAEYAREFLQTEPERDVSRPPRLRDEADGSWKSWEELEEPVVLSDEETAAMKALYDGEILWVDHWLGQFFAALEEEGIYDDAVVVFLSDHGEEFGDHQGWFHGRSLYEEMIGMPLLIKLPRAEVRGASQLSLDAIDLLPTLCGLSGIDAPAYVQGRDYADQLALSGSEPISYFAEEPPHLYALRVGDWKIIERRRGEQHTARLFDLSSDPAEKHDRSEVAPDSLARMREALNHLIVSFEAARADLGAVTGAAPSPDTAELLRSLGYVE